MPYILFAFLILFNSSAWAADNMRPLFHNPNIHMTYPSVAGDYLVFSQRINNNSQVMRFNWKNFNAEAIDISPMTEKDAIRNGIALTNGDIAYISNRLGYFTPWLSQQNKQSSFAIGTFNSILLPIHLDASGDGERWVFDSTLESTRRPRIENQFSDDHLHTQLLGQAWRLYHDKYWAIKSDYPKTSSGISNKFMQPNIFTFSKNSDSVDMLGDGFGATLSPDGKSIVFVRDNNGNFDLWKQNIDGSDLTRLTRSGFADLEPNFSPDGKHIAVISNRDEGGDVLQTSVYTLELASGKIVRITTGSNVTDGGPAWLDDQTIIFHSNRDPQSPQTETVDNWRLWTINIAK